MCKKNGMAQICHTWKVMKKVRHCVQVNMQKTVMEGLNANRFEDAILQF